MGLWLCIIPLVSALSPLHKIQLCRHHIFWRFHIIHLRSWFWTVITMLPVHNNSFVDMRIRDHFGVYFIIIFQDGTCLNCQHPLRISRILFQFRKSMLKSWQHSVVLPEWWRWWVVHGMLHAHFSSKAHLASEYCCADIYNNLPETCGTVNYISKYNTVTDTGKSTETFICTVVQN